MRRDSEWWNEGVKMKVEEKKRAFEEWLQCNSVEKYERYREKNVEAKRKVEEAKRMSNFKWGQDFDRSYEENKKKFWKEVRRVKKGGSRTEETVKDVNGRLLRGNEARKRWAEYFEELLNVQEDREADIVAVGGVQVPVMGEENEREITIEEVKRALNETKGGKAPGMDGVRVEMLKEGGVTVLEWLVRLFNICFMLSVVPVDWVIPCMVPLYKGKGDMYECSNFRAECQKSSIYCFLLLYTGNWHHRYWIIYAFFLRGKTIFIFLSLLLANCITPLALSDLKSCTNTHGVICTGN